MSEASQTILPARREIFELVESLKADTFGRERRWNRAEDGGEGRRAARGLVEKQVAKAVESIAVAIKERGWREDKLRLT